MKKVVLFILIAIFSISILSQNQQKPFDFADYGVRIEPDKRLIVVMAALDMGGLEAKLSPEGEAFRAKLREDLAETPADTRQKLKIFIEQYRRRRAKLSPEEVSAPFVSLAYSLSPVPELADPSKTDDLPADLLEVFDFAPLVREFYRRSNIGLRISRYVEIFQSEGDKMRPGAKQMALGMLDYLHTRPKLNYIEKITTTSKGKGKGKSLSKTEVREHERRFFIVPDLFAPLNTVNFRNVGDDYYVVVPPKTNLQASEARRAYLQFVFDALVADNAKDIAAFRDGIKELIGDKQGPVDIYAAVVKSLVAAADAKQVEYERNYIATFQARAKIDATKGDEAKRAVSKELDNFKKGQADEVALQLSEAYEDGAVLAFYFADQFKGMEDSGFDIASSMKDMILSLDISKEKDRLAQNLDAKARALKARRERREKLMENTAAIQSESQKDKEFREKMKAVEAIINIKDYTKADNELIQLLADFPEYKARIYYAKARAASLFATEATDETIQTERLGKAAENYRFAIQFAGEGNPDLRSQAHVALGRILEFNDQKEKAMLEYEAAIKIGNVNNGAFRQAEAAKERLAKKP